MAEPVAARTIPVTLIAGYLGAGKTTWLNARIRQGLPAGALILVNDFGAINVDAALIEYQGDRLLQLSDGCLCCSLSDSLAAQLARIARWPEPPTALIIETSGVARPGRLADLIRVARQFHLSRIVTLVDLGSLATRLADPRVGALVAEQIESADCLALNRGERLDGPTRQRMMARLRALNRHAAGLEELEGPEEVEELEAAEGEEGAAEATYSALSPDVPGAPAAVLHPDRRDPAIQWQRFAVTLPPSLSRQELETLLARHADSLARAKGILCAEGRRYVFQWSAGQAHWTPAAARARSGQLVGIGFAGAGFDALVAALERLS